MSFDSDSTLIEGLKAGGSQRQIFERDLYKTYFYLIQHGSKKYGIVVEDAASAYSDTIISVIHQILSSRFEGRSSLKSYVFQIFSNKCVDLLRKEATNKRKADHGTSLDSLVLELPEQARSVVEQLILKEQQTNMMRKLNEIGEKCKMVLLYYEDGYSDREIASMMEYNSAEVVKTSRLRCLDKLKKLMTAKSHYNG